MLRILLVLEDYAELVFLQTLLKKLGFDVVGVQREGAIKDQLLAFNPEIIFVPLRGRQIQGDQVATRIKQRKGWPKMVALHRTGGGLSAKELSESDLDEQIQTPVNPQAMIQVIARLGNLNAQALSEKFARIRLGALKDEEKDLKIIRAEAGSNSPAPSPKTARLVATPEERAARNARFMALQEPVVQSQFSRDKIAQFTKEIRTSETAEDHEALQKLEEERQAFVRALFVKPDRKSDK